MQQWHLIVTVLFIHVVRYTPLAVLKIKDFARHESRNRRVSVALPQVIGFSPEARILSANQRQICVQTASFSMELSDWLALSHDTLCGRGCGRACGCARGCDCHNAKISLFYASKSSLTASYFRLIVSNLLSLHVQLPQTKAAPFRPQILWHFAVGKARTNKSRRMQCRGRRQSTLQVSPGSSS